MYILRWHITLLVLSWFIGLPPTTVWSFDLLSLKPGMSRAAVEEVLRRESIRPTLYGSDALLLTIPVVPHIIERQRSLLEFDSRGVLSLVDIQIIPEHDSSGIHIMNLFDTVKDWITGRLGPPAWQRIEGSSNDEELREALSMGRVFRLLQWENSHTIRFGIPLRASGDLLFEIMIAKRMLPADSKYWGRRRF